MIKPSKQARKCVTFGREIAPVVALMIQSREARRGAWSCEWSRCLTEIKTSEQLVRDTYRNVRMIQIEGDESTGERDMYIVACGNEMPDHVVLSCQMSESLAWLVASLTI